MLNVVYRCCELETGNKPKRDCRPFWFSKENCLNILIKEFNNSLIKMHAIHDGPKGPLFSILESNNIHIEKINCNSNKESLATTLDYALNLDGTYLYLVEDDYLHKQNSYNVLIDGLKTIGLHLTLYDHTDRYTRQDDIDYGKTKLFLGQYCHWRTAESTTCTWATTQDYYKSTLYELAKYYLLEDREFFRKCKEYGVPPLMTPIPGYSTHCHTPFVSHYTNWSSL